MYLFSSISSTFGHIYVIGSTGICIVYFSRGIISPYSVWDIIYGLLAASFPSWGTSILWILWVGSKVEGWRWEVVYWAFVVRQLTYLLPEYYGNDIEVRHYRFSLYCNHR